MPFGKNSISHMHHLRSCSQNSCRNAAACPSQPNSAEVKSHFRGVPEERILLYVWYNSFKIFRESHMQTQDIRLNARTPMPIQTALCILHGFKRKVTNEKVLRTGHSLPRETRVTFTRATSSKSGTVKEFNFTLCVLYGSKMFSFPMSQVRTSYVIFVTSRTANVLSGAPTLSRFKAFSEVSHLENTCSVTR